MVEIKGRTVPKPREGTRPVYMKNDINPDSQTKKNHSYKVILAKS
jgi:hypothetical protein